MKDALQITGVAEVVLSVRNLPLMREFYRDVLGFALHSEGCYDQGPKPTPGGEATSSFLTVRQIDTPLGRNGHPQLLALDRLQTSRLCQETPVWPRADHLHAQSRPSRFPRRATRRTYRGSNPWDWRRAYPNSPTWLPRPCSSRIPREINWS